jgi:hypothetical protein
MSKILLAAFAIAAAIVGVLVFRNADNDDNGLFWKTSGALIIGLAGLVAYLAIK